MRASQFHFATLKEAPADADIISQKLMIRAGMIKKISAGIYTYMPLGLRVIRKVEAIVRQEMNRAGAIEMLMPIVQPADLWQETHRFDNMGAELLRIKDRHERDFVLQPTSEEAVTDMARQEFKSYKQLPKNVYQIQTKFRDERRPRFGLMRGREFTMKDGYSFDRDTTAAHASYTRMANAYRRIFDRFGLNYRAVAADSGAIGGDKSEEFQVIAATGEDAIVYCPNSDYAANIETAQAIPPSARNSAKQSMQKVNTLHHTACEDIAKFLNVPLNTTVKLIVLATDQESTDTQLHILLLRGDHELNETKVSKLDGLSGFRWASETEIMTHFNCPAGYLGIVNIPHKAHSLRIIVDREVASMSDWVCGANEVGFHFVGVNWGRDLPEPEWVADIRNVIPGDASPDGKGILAIERGIEVGHVFYLGTKYSAAMNANFLDIDGKPKLFEMGCYGIGITRLPAAAIEQNHDDKGMIWPDSIAPFTLVICALGIDRSDAVKQAAETVYQDLLSHNIDVLLDDRGERPGIMFADWELIGVPHRITISERSLKAGHLEYTHRRSNQTILLAIAESTQHILSMLT